MDVARFDANTPTFLPSRRERVLGRLIIPTRTSLPPSEVDEIQNMGMLASPLFTQKRGKCRETSCDVLTQEKVEPRSKRIQESYSGREKIFTEHRELRNFFDCKQIMSPKEKKQLCPNSLKRNTIRNHFLRNRRIIYCLKHDPC